MGEQVPVLSPFGQTARGFAVTGLSSDLTRANGDRAGLHRRTYPNDAVVEYWSQPY